MKGVKYKDEDMEEETEVKEDIPVFGDIKLNEDEKAYLSNPPDHALHGKISKEEMTLEIELGLAKVRMNRRNREFKGYDEENEESKEEKGEREKEDDKDEARNKLVLDIESKTVDFGRL